jgi:CheY-like chemotaxis protein
MAQADVLIVDDDDDFRTIAAEVLGERGLEVATAASGAEALELLDAGLLVELLITDHLMPGMSGVELLDAVRARGGKGPFVLMTGNDKCTAPFVMLRKPISIGALLGVVRYHLDRRG